MGIGGLLLEVGDVLGDVLVDLYQVGGGDGVACGDDGTPGDES